MLALDMFRFNSRMRALTVAIGVCVAFIVGSFAFADGLGETVKNITTKFESQGIIAYSGDNLSESRIDLSQIDVDKGYASVRYCEGLVDNTTRSFFAVQDTFVILRGDLEPPPRELFSSYFDYLRGPINISTEHGSLELWANRSFSSPMFPLYWHLIGWENFTVLEPGLEGNASFLIFSSADKGLIDSLRSQGLNVKEMTAILHYFSAGSGEVKNDLWLIIVPSSFIVAMLVYAAVAMEAKDRSKDIAVLKTMGANRRQIGGIFLFQAMVLSILGGLFGIMLGIIFSYMISTSSSIMIESSLFYLDVTEYSMFIALASSIVAGTVGSIAPILRATSRGVREAMK